MSEPVVVPERLFAIGPAVESERSFVAHSWKESLVSALTGDLKRRLQYYLPHSRQAAQRSAENLFPTVRGLAFEQLDHDIARLLRGNSTVLVARDPNDAAFVFGWLCAGYESENVFAVYYSYTRKHFRRLGVLTALLRRLLELVPSDKPELECVYVLHSNHDALFEQMGFTYQPMQGAV